MPPFRAGFFRTDSSTSPARRSAARLTAALILIGTAAGLWGCAGTTPSDSVSGNVFRSSFYPDVAIAPAFDYLGGTTSGSLTSHEVETHVFGEPEGEAGRFKRVIVLRVLRLKNRTDWLTGPFDGRSCSAGSGSVRLGDRMHPYCMDFVRFPLAPGEQRALKLTGDRLSGPYFNRSFGRNAGQIRIVISYNESLQYLGDTAGYAEEWDDLPPLRIIRPDYIADMNRRCRAAIRISN